MRRGEEQVEDSLLRTSNSSEAAKATKTHIVHHLAIYSGMEYYTVVDHGNYNKDIHICATMSIREMTDVLVDARMAS